MDSKEVTAILVRVLSPYIGNMARYTVDTHAGKLGLGSGSLADKDLEALVARLGAGLRIFVGREKSARLIVEMRQALAAANGVRG
jgi:hypothetical protein